MKYQKDPTFPRTEAASMTAIHRDYLPPKPEPVSIPPELALLIVRKAARMAEQFEEKALDEMIRAARRRLRDGIEPPTIIRQLGL